MNKKLLTVLVIALIATALKLPSYDAEESDKQTELDTQRIVISNDKADKHQEITNEELEDLTLIAESEGITLKEAIERFGWQSDFVRVANDLEEFYPDTFTGATFNENRGAWFGFKGEIPKAAIDLVNQLPGHSEIVGRIGYSESELEKERDIIHDKVYQLDNIVDVSSHYDIGNGVILVELQLIDSLSPHERKQIMEKLMQIQPKSKSISVEYELVERLESGNDNDI